MDVLNDKRYNFLSENDDLKNNIALLVKGGSNAYHLSSDSSDFDLRGITIENEDTLLGIRRFDCFVNKETDTTIYGLKQFISMAMKSNPNALEILFTDEEDIIYCSDIGKILLENRNLFLSKQILNPILGITANNRKRYLDTYISSQKDKCAVGKDSINKINKVYCETIRRLLVGLCLARTGKFIVNAENLINDDSLVDVRVSFPFLKDLYKVKYAENDRYFDVNVIDILESILEPEIKCSNTIPDRVDRDKINELQKECFKMNLNKRKIFVHFVNCLGIIPDLWYKEFGIDISKWAIPYRYHCTLNTPDDLMGTCFICKNDDRIIGFVFSHYLHNEGFQHMNYDAVENGVKELRSKYPLDEIVVSHRWACAHQKNLERIKEILERYHIK